MYIVCRKVTVIWTTVFKRRRLFWFCVFYLAEYEVIP